MSDVGGEERLRLDKWLWQARFFKSRTLAAAQVTGGGFRVNRELVRKSRHLVKPGDVLTFSKGPYVRVIEIVALGVRRGPAAEAAALYRDLNPPDQQPKAAKNPRQPLQGQREMGSGRPTKKQRREIDELLGRTSG